MDFDGFDGYRTDENLESGQGVRIEYDDGRAFVIHRAGGSNRKFVRVLEAKMKPFRRQLDQGTLPDGVAERLMREAYAEAIVIGWDGITAGGKPVPFTRDNVVSFFEAFPDVFRAIQRDANDLAVFRAEQRAEDEGNSATSSAGS